MRAGRSTGLSVVVLGTIAAAVAWAPGVAARQQQSTNQKQKTVTVTVDDKQGSEPRILTRIDQGNALFSFGGPRLGVAIRDVASEDVAKLKLAGTGGVVVEEVTKDSAAAKAGVKAGDVILQFDGEAVRSARQLTRLVAESATGRALKVGIVRDGKRMDIEATLTEAQGTQFETSIDREGLQKEVERGMANAEPMLRQFRLQNQPGTGTLRTPGAPNQSWTLQTPFFSASENRGRLGVTIQELTPELATYFGVKDGVLVSAVRADSPAAKAGIKAGDVITTINDKPVTDGDSLVTQLSDKSGDVTIGVTRDRKAMSVKAPLDKIETPRRKVIIRGIGA